MKIKVQETKTVIKDVSLDMKKLKKDFPNGIFIASEIPYTDLEEFFEGYDVESSDGCGLDLSEELLPALFMSENEVFKTLKEDYEWQADGCEFEEALCELINLHRPVEAEDVSNDDNFGARVRDYIFRLMAKEARGDWYKAGKPKKISDYIIEEQIKSIRDKHPRMDEYI